MAKSRIRNVFAAGLLTTGLLAAGLALCATGVASAAGDPPPSGDPRAVVHSGNAVTCVEAGLAGDVIELTASISGNTYLTVTGVPAGTTVTGVVVKGSDGYNVYLPGALGAVPWSDLHSPIAGNSGEPATISHWFACGTETTTTTTTTTASTTTTTASTITTTTTPSTTVPTTTTTCPSTESSSTVSTTTSGSTTTSAPPTTAVTTTSVTTTSDSATTSVTTMSAPTMTTTSEAAAPQAAPPVDTGGQALAYTGFSGGWLIVLALVLMLCGLSLLTIPSLLARRH